MIENASEYGGMECNGVMAVVACLNSGENIRDVVFALKSQVEQILIVDNGSEDETVRILESLATSDVVRLVLLAENLGVGGALNIGVRKAVADGFTWLLTMDQDSLPSNGMVGALIAAAGEQGRHSKILSPNLISSTNQRVRDGSIAYAITSGNLIHLTVFREIGMFREDFFVDCIDFEFSLRARKAGYDIRKVADAFMHHDVGMSGKNVPKVFEKFYTQHPPLRRYYSFRNLLVLSKEYFQYFPGFVVKLLVLQSLYLVFIAVFDVDRSENLREISRGIVHGVQGRMGKYKDRIL